MNMNIMKSHFGIATVITVSALLLANISSAQQQPIGKLFSTPEERVYLDYLRSEFLLNSQETVFNIDRTITPEIPVEETAEPEPAIVEFSLGGILNRRDGTKTVWLNNGPVNEADLPDSISLQMQNGALALRIVGDSATYFLRPGQRVNLNTGVVSESFQARNTTNEAQPPGSSQGDGETSAIEDSTDISNVDILEEAARLTDILQQNPESDSAP